VEAGLYKVEFQLAGAAGRGVLYVRNGRMLGGNSAFAFVGTYDDTGDTIDVEISTVRHHVDPSYRPLFGTDVITLKVKGRPVGDVYAFEGGAVELPNVPFKSVMTRINGEENYPGTPASGGIRDGLYSIHIRMLDGIDGGNTGVMVLDHGKIRGGDAFFDYIGKYTSSGGRWRGELINHEHTASQGQRPLFGGHEVGIGFTGSYTDDGAEADATALAGKRSIRFHAVLKRIAPI